MKPLSKAGAGSQGPCRHYRTKQIMEAIPDRRDRTAINPALVASCETVRSAAPDRFGADQSVL